MGNVLCTDRQLTLDTPARVDVGAGGDLGKGVTLRGILINPTEH